MKQTRTGAKAEKHEFTGGFIATMPRGYKEAFKPLRKDSTANKRSKIAT